MIPILIKKKVHSLSNILLTATIQTKVSKYTIYTSNKHEWLVLNSISNVMFVLNGYAKPFVYVPNIESYFGILARSDECFYFFFFWTLTLEDVIQLHFAFYFTSGRVQTASTSWLLG